MAALDGAATGWFSRHLVALEVTYTVRHQTKPHEVARSYYTGFLLYEKQATIWVTAGHCMEEIQTEILGNPEAYSDVKFRFVDMLHTAAVSDEPFFFQYSEETFKGYLFHRDDRGVEIGWDFGVIFLRSHYSELLYANNIVPVLENNWVNVPSEFDLYFMLGLPGEGVTPLNETTVSARPMMFSITKLSERPECFSEQTDPMFYATIDPESAVRSVKGMSGGPILGMQIKDDKTARYWVIGIQSKWQAEQRIVCASPLSDLRNILIQVIDTIRPRPDEEQE